MPHAEPTEDSLQLERKDSLNNRIIGLNIKKYRKEKHLTQERLAEALDISTVHMSHIEGGSVSMSLDLLLRICETLGASPNQILEGSYAPPSSPERTSSSELLLGGLSPELRLLCCDMIELMKKSPANIASSRVMFGDTYKRPIVSRRISGRLCRTGVI